jgi:hypothetical protein
MDGGALAMGRLEDGTPYFAPVGEIAYDGDEDRVQCHLCGGWFRLVGGTHLNSTHGWTLERYRHAFRLPKGVPTCSRELSESHHRTAVAVGLGTSSNTPEEDRALAHAASRAVQLPRWRSLAVKRPELAAELHPTRNGDLDSYSVGPGSRRKVWWRCALWARMASHGL